MRQQLNKIDRILDRQDWKLLFGVTLLVVVTTMMEILGIFSILPFMQVVADPAVIESNQWLAWMKGGLGVSSDRRFMIILGVGVLAIFTLSSVANILATWLTYRSIWIVAHRIGVRLLNHYARLPFEFFHLNSTPELVKKAISDIHNLVSGVLLAGSLLVASVFKSLVILVMLFFVSPMLSLVSFLIYGSAYLVMHLARHRYISKLGKEKVQATSDRYQYFTETLIGMKTLRVSGAASAFIKRFDISSERFSKIQPAFLLANLLPRHLIELLAFGGIVSLILYLLMSDVSLLEVIPTLSVFALATYKLLPALSSAFTQAANLSHNWASIEVVYEDMREHETMLPPADEFASAESIRFQNEIAVDRVSYRYRSSDAMVLNDVSLRIPRGSRCALVGSTGCGKSTLIDIMVGVLFPHKGAIRIDGIAVDRENAFGWQNMISYVPQEVFLYDSTITANIALGIPLDEIDMDRVMAVSRLAMIDEFIETEAPDGYETMIGERGGRLSGGQRQRVGLARAFYRQPKVLILDEATSALDGITEEAVMSAIENELPELTVVMIAHRLSTVRFCDRIFLMENGRVAGSGSYEQLYNGNSSFREMVNAGENSV